MKRGGLEKVDLVNVDAGLMDSPWHYRRILDIRDLPLTELLFTHYADLKIRRDGCEDHASRVRMENARLRDELAQRDRRAHELEGALARRDEDVRHITSSVSFRLGRAVTAPGRSLRDRLSRRDG